MHAFDAALGAASFFREESSAQLVSLTSVADDGSTAGLADLLDWSVAFRADERFVALHLVSACDADAGDFEAAAVALGGGVFPLCPATELRDLALAIALSEWDYPLSARPQLDSIRVTVEEGGVTYGFSLWAPGDESGDYVVLADRNSIRFLRYRPPPSAVVSVEYEPAADHF